MSSLIKTSLKDGIYKIQIKRSDKKNALTTDMYTDLTNSIVKAEQNSQVNVIYLTGSDDSFCAGNDLQDFLSQPPTFTNSPAHKFLNTISQTKLPIVAAVNGTAVGIGVTMLLHCDFVYIQKDAQLSLPFINLGLVPEAGSSLILPYLAGHQKASELLMLGEPFTPELAKEIGLANAICDAQSLHSIAMKTAKKLSLKPREALIQTKALMKREFESVSKRIEEEGKHFEDCLKSDDTKNALKNFLNAKPKNKPSP